MRQTVGASRRDRTLLRRADPARCLLVYWADANGATVVHVEAFEKKIVHTQRHASRADL
ncbi:hypothetical protein [Bradyrhizobium sp. LHD-71]|uniref:MoaF-related domain-containing protein n=1 Tax=Bradyrhizobium sp. LHD-71 TaxID=3072141 RepID=UPI0035BE1781